MHAYRKLIDQEMVARKWDRQDLEREAGLSRAQVHRLVTDDRGRLPQPPHAETVQALAKAFRLSDESVWSAVAEAMGLPRSAAPSITHEVKAVSDEELVKELASRLGLAITVRHPKASQPAQEDEGQKTVRKAKSAAKKPGGQGNPARHHKSSDTPRGQGRT